MAWGEFQRADRAITRKWLIPDADTHVARGRMTQNGWYAKVGTARKYTLGTGTEGPELPALESSHLVRSIHGL
jgi:hypothetical protein